MIRTVGLLGLMLLFISCAPVIWSRSNTSESQRDRDLEACRLEGLAYYTEILPRVQDYDVILQDFENGPSDLYFRLLNAAERSVESTYDDYVRDNVSTYQTSCMQQKGYQRVST